jgi:hypothetical protein
VLVTNRDTALIQANEIATLCRLVYGLLEFPQGREFLQEGLLELLAFLGALTNN